MESEALGQEDESMTQQIATRTLYRLETRFALLAWGRCSRREESTRDSLMSQTIQRLHGART